MARKKKRNLSKLRAEKLKNPRFNLPYETKRAIWGVIMFFLAIVVILSFFDLAGPAGRFFIRTATLLLGRTVFIIPLLLAVAGIIIFNTQRRNFLTPILFAFSLGLIGVAGIFGSLGIYQDKTIEEMGGWFGYFISWLPMSIFGVWVSLIFFSALVLTGIITLWQMKPKIIKSEEDERQEKEKGPMPTVFRKIVAPKFEIHPVESPSKIIEPVPVIDQDSVKKKNLPVKTSTQEMPILSRSVLMKDYEFPPLDLLESDRGQAQSGDIKINSAIIKRTLENFGIPVEISEVNVGPTVTQYALKPAEGIKLSRIVSLSNDLALALAAHPIRIEAPIPGRPLVGIEVPNRVRAQVRLRNLLADPRFTRDLFGLNIALGRDVAGEPVFADLAKMPHLLVAGSTGTGKTIGLNAILISLLYQHSPETLRFILVDPKRVEFPVYNDLPHLLTPVIYDAQRTVNALKWLVGEMERRFDVFSAVKARDIASYNAMVLKERSEKNNRGHKETKELMPYIVLIIDELADLMAARGREMEAGIVRLAQMARAVGIHLVVATQRPSVEVITGLIKANITARMAFQVASQVDSRTILDTAGAEKLLGRGDMLFVSAEVSKPKRIQGAYVSEAEVRRVVQFIKKKVQELEKQEDKAGELAEDIGAKLSEDLTRSLEKVDTGGAGFWFEEGDDPLYEEAKKLVIETRKASASFLQRRLRVGYARAARLIDLLEERGIVGPAEGAKPREVLVPPPSFEGKEIDENQKEEENEEGWIKV